MATLECAGNGRVRFGPAAHGERWAEGAVGSAWWAGVPLERVLRLAGIAPRAREVVFRGADSGEVEDLTGEPFNGYFQASHYVYEWPRGGRLVREPVRLQRVRALVTEPAAGSWRSAGDLEVRGIAWSGSAPVTRVEVAIGGGPWREAELAGRPPDHGWRRWSLTATGVPPGLTRIRARARDAAGHDQLTAPEWNRRGYGGNFVHEVTARLS